MPQHYAQLHNKAVLVTDQAGPVALHRAKSLFQKALPDDRGWRCQTLE